MEIPTASQICQPALKHRFSDSKSSPQAALHVALQPQGSEFGSSGATALRNTLQDTKPVAEPKRS